MKPDRAQFPILRTPTPNMSGVTKDRSMIEEVLSTAVREILTLGVST
jgi:hypothetical protein